MTGSPFAGRERAVKAKAWYTLAAGLKSVKNVTSKRKILQEISHVYHGEVTGLEGILKGLNGIVQPSQDHLHIVQHRTNFHWCVTHQPPT